MLSKLKKRIADTRWGKIMLDLEQPHIITNINYNPTDVQKKILLIYLDYGSVTKEISEFKRRTDSGSLHTNRYELFVILHVFSELNYVVDVCGNNDESAIEYIKSQKYDYIIGLGDVFRWCVDHMEAMKILYLTENPYYISYHHEAARIEYYFSRTGKKVELVRSGTFYKLDEEKKVDAIIGMCEEEYLKQVFVPKQIIYPSAFKNTKKIDYSNRCKKSFLLFGADGFIHKGVDVLVEVFSKHPEWQLYLCGSYISGNIEKLLGKCYLTENIHDCGYVAVNSQVFIELSEKCSFIILASCSESISTGVLTGMRHGMIPVVTKESVRSEIFEYCYLLNDFYIEQIEHDIEEIMTISSEELELKQTEVERFANQEFSLTSFKERFTKAFKNVIGDM